METPFGRIGVAVCYDLYFPELTRGLALAGADLIAVPANLPLFPRPEGERPVEIALAQATAHVSKVWVAVCDRTGPERGVEWTGASCIVDPDGWLAAGPVDGYGDGILYADCDLALARDKAWGERNDVRGDLRPELYASRAACERPLEYRLLERARREPVARLQRPLNLSSRTGTRPSASTSASASMTASSSGAKMFVKRGAPAVPRSELEVVPDLDPGPVETRGIEVALVGVQGLAEGGRSDGERDLVAARRQDLGRVEPRGVSAPVGDHDPLPVGTAAAQNVPRGRESL